MSPKINLTNFKRWFIWVALAIVAAKIAGIVAIPYPIAIFLVWIGIILRLKPGGEMPLPPAHIPTAELDGQFTLQKDFENREGVFKDMH